MRHAEIVRGIAALHPGAQFQLSGDSYDNIVWLDKRPKPTEAEVMAAASAPIPSEVDAERDRRLERFVFEGREFDFCDGKGSDINIAGAGTLALAAIILGAQEGNLRWSSPDKDFYWIAADNTAVPMDARKALDFAKAAAEWKARHIYAARVLKDMRPIPSDFASDARWS